MCSNCINVAIVDRIDRGGTVIVHSIRSEGGKITTKLVKDKETQLILATKCKCSLEKIRGTYIWQTPCIYARTPVYMIDPMREKILGRIS